MIRREKKEDVGGGNSEIGSSTRLKKGKKNGCYSARSQNKTAIRRRKKKNLFPFSQKRKAP